MAGSATGQPAREVMRPAESLGQSILPENNARCELRGASRRILRWRAPWRPDKILVMSIAQSPVRKSRGPRMKLLDFVRRLLGAADAEELQRIRVDLEERVAQRTAELTAANAALKSELDVRERFEEALFSAREWFEVTLASIGDGVIVAD